MGEGIRVVGDWWETFFDEHYLSTYAVRQDGEKSRQEALAAVALVATGPGARVLDLPCGFGRHALPLAEAGYRVVGVDRSWTLLSEARRRRGTARWPLLVRADFRAIPCADRRFDLALNLFTSFGYLGDELDKQVLREFRRVLRPGGYLVMETMHRDLVARNFQPRDVKALPNGAYVVEEQTFDLLEGVIDQKQTLLSPGEMPSERSFRVRAYTATELVRMVKEAGFVDIACHGDLKGAPFSLDTRLTLAARVPGTQ